MAGQSWPICMKTRYHPLRAKPLTRTHHYLWEASAPWLLSGSLPSHWRAKRVCWYLPGLVSSELSGAEVLVTCEEENVEHQPIGAGGGPEKAVRKEGPAKAKHLNTTLHQTQWTLKWWWARGGGPLAPFFYIGPEDVSSHNCIYSVLFPFLLFLLLSLSLSFNFGKQIISSPAAVQHTLI